jgi:hypothetical protein
MAYAEPVLRPPRAACARAPEAQWRDGGWRGSAGDEVDFTAAQIGGVLTITKIQKK